MQVGCKQVASGLQVPGNKTFIQKTGPDMVLQLLASLQEPECVLQSHAEAGSASQPEAQATKAHAPSLFPLRILTPPHIYGKLLFLSQRTSMNGGSAAIAETLFPLAHQGNCRHRIS